MAKRLLIETRVDRSLTLCEGVQSKTPGCLGTLKGPCADYHNPTRNSNFYSRKLWENVFNDELVKESLEDKVLIGELDHPGDRLETKATLAAIVMTDYEFDDDKGVVIGTFDILDTPNGKILRSLLDYGCRIGVSSRGEGDVSESSDRNVVDEDTYYFVAFDAVVLPAVKKAKPSLQESLKRKSLKESLESQISSASTQGELNIIKRVVETSSLPDSDSLLESVENKSKELEGTNSSSNLLEDLEKSTVRISQLEEEVKKLKQEVTNCKSRTKRFVESRVKLSKELSRQSEEYDSLEESYKSVVFELGSVNRKVEDLTTSLQESVSSCKELEFSLSTSEETARNYQSQVDSLSESLDSSQRRLVSLTEKNRKLSEQVSSIKKDCDSKVRSAKLNESRAKKQLSQVSKSLQESQRVSRSFIRDYVKRKSEEVGFNPKSILESVTSKTTIDQVNQLIEEAVDRDDRYRRVPTTNDTLLEALADSKVTIKSGSSPSDRESSQFRSFMDQAYNLKN